MRAAAALFALLCLAQAPPPGRPDELPPEPPVATLSYLPRGDRMTVPVTVAGQPGFRFVVDTGAQRSVLAREVAAKLELSPGRPVRLISMSGINTVPTARVPVLAAGPLGGHSLEAPLLAAADLDADGMLGVDALQGYALNIDFGKRTMAVRRANARRTPITSGEYEVVVVAKSRFGQLVVTDAFYRGQRVRVVIDTGSAASMGNEALRKLVTKRQTVTPVRMRDVVGAWVDADYTQIESVSIGEVVFQNLPIAFAEVQPFRSFALTDRPAILLGMDALSLFHRVDIDFANRRIRFVRSR